MSETSDFDLSSTLEKLKTKIILIMRKIMSIVRVVFDYIFPLVACYACNKKIRNKMFCCNILDDVKNYKAISLDTLKCLYSDAIHQKDKLEDKAKTNIIGITIAISLILGASNFLNVIYAKNLQSFLLWMQPYQNIRWVMSHSFFTWGMFLLFVCAVLYLIIAGILAIRVLIDENQVFVIDLKNFAADEADLKQDYGQKISQNCSQNLIRNNIVYTSYEFIRNALICLFILLIFLAIPSTIA